MSAYNAQGENLSPQRPNFCMYCGAPVADVRTSFCMICGKPLGVAYPDVLANLQRPARITRRPTEVPGDLEQVTWPAYISLLMPILSFLFLTVLTLVVAIITFLILPIQTLAFVYSPEFLVTGLFLEACFVVPSFLYLRKYFPPHSTQYRFQVMGLPDGRDKKQMLIEILIGAGIGFGMIFLVSGLQYLSEALWGALLGPNFVENGVTAFGETEMGVVPVNPVELVLIWVAMFVSVGFGEEILYRGFTQRGLVKGWGKSAGILVTAILFTFAHILPGIVSIETFVVFFIPYFAISILLGSLREWRKGNLIACIIAHGLYNSLLLTFAFLGF